MKRTMMYAVLTLIAVFTVPCFLNADDFPNSIPVTPYFQLQKWNSSSSAGPLFKDWDQATDNNLIFYKVKTPLSVTIPAGQENDGFQAVYTMFNNYTSLSMERKYNQTVGQRKYYYTNWTNCGSFIYFGGGSDSGQVYLPNPGWIKAAHQNGKVILGTLFFTWDDSAQADWINGDLQDEETLNSYAEKLADIAIAYGFDGWFINQEAKPGDVTTDLNMNNLCTKIVAKGNLKGKELIINWYQAQDLDFKIIPQLSKNAMLFPDYYWNDSTYDGIKKSGFPLDRVYYGQDIFKLVVGDIPGGPYVKSMSDFDNNIKNIIKYKGSAGLFDLQGILGDPPVTKGLTYIDAEYIKFITDHLSDLSANSSSVTTLPFVTYFNTGQGNNYFIDGNSLDFGLWNDMGQQDILPNYRVNNLYDYTDGYYGGSSLAFDIERGKVDLYSSDLAATNCKIQIIYKYSDQTGKEAALILNDNLDKAITLVDDGKSEWQTKNISLSMDKITLISVQLNGRKLNIGKIFVGSVDAAPTVSNISVTSEKDMLNAEYNAITWDTKTDAFAYEIYDSSNKFIARTSQKAFATVDSSSSPKVISVSYSGVVSEPRPGSKSK